MRKRNYLIGILVLLIILGLLITVGVYFYGEKNGQHIEYKDLVAIFTAFIVSGSFIIATLNTKLSANLNQEKLDFDKLKFKNDKKIIAYNLFKEYNSEAMTQHSEVAVPFFRNIQPATPASLIAAVDANKEASKAVTMLLNHLELVSISYTENIADKDLLKELFIDIFKRHISQFGAYIGAKQGISPNFFDTFTEVVKEWSK